ncbi:hypothetical protein FKM82_028178 [Ascaphus truei]
MDQAAPGSVGSGSPAFDGSDYFGSGGSGCVQVLMEQVAPGSVGSDCSRVLMGQPATGSPLPPGGAATSWFRSGCLLGHLPLCCFITGSAQLVPIGCSSLSSPLGFRSGHLVPVLTRVTFSLCCCSSLSPFFTLDDPFQGFPPSLPVPGLQGPP